MKRVLSLGLMLGLLLSLAGACSSVKPLKAAYYRKNIVVKADETVWVNDVQVNMDAFRSSLVSQMVFEETPIMVHFHEDLTRDAFDDVLGKLRDEGFKNIRCVVYRD